MENKNLVKATVEFDGEVRTAEGEAMYGVVFSDDGDSYDMGTFLMGETSLNDLAAVISGSIMELDGIHHGLCSLITEKLLIKKLCQLCEEEDE